MELGRPRQSQRRYCCKWGRLGGASAGRLVASWQLWGRTGGGLGRPGGVLGASRGALRLSREHLKPVLNRIGAEELDPRQVSQVGALGESWRKAVLEARGRILDRGRSFQPWKE